MGWFCSSRGTTKREISRESPQINISTNLVNRLSCGCVLEISSLAGDICSTRFVISGKCVYVCLCVWQYITFDACLKKRLLLVRWLLSRVCVYSGVNDKTHSTMTKASRYRTLSTLDKDHRVSKWCARGRVASIFALTVLQVTTCACRVSHLLFVISPTLLSFFEYASLGSSTATSATRCTV